MTTIWGPTVYPTTLDSFAPNLIDLVDVVLASHQNVIKDAVEAIEAKLNVDNSPILGTGGLELSSIGHIANPGTPGEGCLWLDSAAASPVSELIYTDTAGVDHIIDVTPAGNNLDDSYRVGPDAVVDVDLYDVQWALTGAYSFVVDLALATGVADGFTVVNGTDQVSFLRSAANAIAVDIDVETFDAIANGAISIQSIASNYSAGNVNATSTVQLKWNNGQQQIYMTPGGMQITDSRGDLVIAANAGYGRFGSTVSYLDLYSTLGDPRAIRISASNIAGGIDIDAGTGGLAIDVTGNISISGNANVSINSDVTSSGIFEVCHTVVAGPGTLFIGAPGWHQLQVGSAWQASAGQMALQTAYDGATEQISITNTAGTGDDSIKIISLTGGIDVNAKTNLSIDAESTLSIGGALTSLDIQIGASASAKQITLGNLFGGTQTMIYSGTGNLSLASTGTTSNAIDIDASAGGIDIDAHDDISLVAATGNMILAAPLGNVYTTASLSINNTVSSGSIYNDCSGSIYNASAGNFFVDALGSGDIPFNDVSDVSLYTDFHSSSIVGVINELAVVLMTYTASGSITFNNFMACLLARTSLSAPVVTIPSALIAINGRKFIIKDKDLHSSVNPITIETQGTELIDGETNAIIDVDGDCLTLISDGSNLYII